MIKYFKIVFLTISLIIIVIYIVSFGNTSISSYDYETFDILMQFSNKSDDFENEMLQIYETQDDDENNLYIEQFKQRKNISFNPKIVLNGDVENGYGNRLYAFLSSLLMAILLDAHLTSNWPEIDKYIQEPLYQAFNKSFYLQYSSRTSSDLVYTARGRSPWKSRRDVNALSQQTLPEDKIIYHFKGYDAFFMELCCVPKYQQKLVNYGLVDSKVVANAQKALNNSKASSKFKQDAVFKVGFEVGHNLLQNFWKIDNTFETWIEKFYAENFKNYIVIAIQLRYHYINWDDTQVFINCAQSIEKALNKTNVKWFVTSDKKENVLKIQSEYSNKIIHTLDYIKAHRIDSVYAKYGGTILDSELMSKSQFLIISGGSTFGFTSAMRMKKLPYYVNGRKNQRKCSQMKLGNPSITPSGFAVF